MRFLIRCSLALVLTLGSLACGSRVPKERVVIIVVDGLRPDYVTAELMPRLNAMANSGVRGLAHHAVFPSVTRVNGPSIFTGRYPGGHGLMGNAIYMPTVDDDRVLNASDAADLRAIDQATGGQLLTAPSLGELLAAQDLRYFAASSGSSGSAMLMNHRGAGIGLVHQDFAIPDSLGPVAAEVLGPPPQIDAGASNVPLVARAVDAVLRIGLDREDADVLSVWLTEPDHTAHAYGIGAPETNAALAGVDAQIGRLLDGLAERGLSESTDILVTSDHGFTTSTGSTPLSRLLVDAGLKQSARSTDVVVAETAITVREGGPARTAAVVRLLQQTDWIGPVFTHDAADGSGLGVLPGTVGYSAVGWNHERSADVLTSYNWSDEKNEFGYSGSVMAPGVANHGSSSPSDLHATLVAAGPHIKQGVSSSVPSGNVDITPTTLALLGVPLPQDVDGRVLDEVLASGPQPSDVVVAQVNVVTATDIDGLHYQLTVHRRRVGDTMYLDGTEVTRTRGPARR
jgi:arylsulfatase A-like enzyme